MRINLRGGGDIASNPERHKSRVITTGHELIQAYGSTAPDSRPGSTRGGQSDRNDVGQCQKPATGQEGGLNAKPAVALPENVARWLKEHYAQHPPKDGAHP